MSDLHKTKSTFTDNGSDDFLLLEVNFLFIFTDKYIEIEIDSALVQRVRFEHREEIKPFGVNRRILKVLFEENVVEAIEKISYLGHNDNYKMSFCQFISSI